MNGPALMSAPLGRTAAGLLLPGAALAAAAWWLEPVAFHRAWLLGFLVWIGLPLGALGLAVIHELCGGRWGASLRRECDAMVSMMPLMGALFVPVLFGLGTLYPWASAAAAADPALAAKAWYLNRTGFAARGLLVLAVWAVLGWLIARRGPRPGALGAVAAIIYMVTGTIAAVDWVMSLEPQWTSRVFGLLFLVGQTLFALAFAVAIAARMSLRPGSELPPKTLRDLGNLLLSFLLLWSYLEFVQLLIVWNGNLPQHVPWYLRRTEGAWSWVALALAVLHFLVPFALLLFRANKEDPRRLAWIAGWLCLMRALDDCWTILPALGGLHWLDAVVPFAMGALLLGWFFRLLRRRGGAAPVHGSPEPGGAA